VTKRREESVETPEVSADPTPEVEDVPTEEGPVSEEAGSEEAGSEEAGSEEAGSEEGLVSEEAEEAALEGDLTEAMRQVANLTADLQRLQAEYLNYKRRVERDRDLVRENATYSALAPVTEVLDTIDRARQHGELDDGLRAVAEQLERAVASKGLEKFGAEGDVFDPTLHEALSHLGTEDGVEVTTVKVVAKAGYRIGERVVRAAQVLVVDPAEG
jgi:molecular chaperone GrpE